MRTIQWDAAAVETQLQQLIRLEGELDTLLFNIRSCLMRLSLMNAKNQSRGAFNQLTEKLRRRVRDMEARREQTRDIINKLRRVMDIFDTVERENVQRFPEKGRRFIQDVIIFPNIPPYILPRPIPPHVLPNDPWRRVISDVLRDIERVIEAVTVPRVRVLPPVIWPDWIHQLWQ